MQYARVSHAKPHRSGWHVTLDCGHTKFLRHAPAAVGAFEPCTPCERIEQREQEGCGGDAVLDRLVP